jgi:chemotaxis family two-component system sensor kinase Cph1
MQPEPTEPIFLYVEDDPMSRQVMRLLLMRTLGYTQLTIFEDSTDFTARLEALPAKPNVIFLDIHMRPYDGFALLKMLREMPDYQNAKIVALTASVMNEEVEQLQQAGFDAGIAKPVSQKVFPELLNAILQGDHIWHVV